MNDLKLEGQRSLWQRNKTTIEMIIIIVAAYILISLVTNGLFLTTTNIINILTSSIVPAFIVIAYCFILSVGIMDLSIGAILVLGCNVGNILAVKAGLGYFGLFVGSIATAVALVSLNFKIIRALKIPSWILGLGMTMVYEGIGAIYNAYMVSINEQPVELGDVCREIGAPPYNVVVLAVGLVIAFFIFNRSSIGFNIRAVGSNLSVAKMMGINVNRTIAMAGIIAGLFVGIACVIESSYANRITPTTGLTSIANIFTPLSAYLLAVVLNKGFNMIIGAIVSAFILTSLFNVLTIFGVPSGTLQKVVMGALVLVCGILSQRKYKGVVQ